MGKKGFFNQKVALQGGITVVAYWLSTMLTPQMTANANWQFVWTMLSIFVGVHLAVYITKGMK